MKSGLELVFLDGVLEDVPNCVKLFFKSEIVIAKGPNSNEPLHCAKE
jgi:hypothetical protein